MPYNKKEFGRNQTLCTQEEIRTPTPIQAPAPQAGASTNSATWVFTIQSFPKASTIPIAIGTAHLGIYYSIIPKGVYHPDSYRDRPPKFELLQIYKLTIVRCNIQ